MTTTTRDTNRYGYPSRQPAEVVAVLVDDGSAGLVAAVAVREAVELHVPVRFLQVVPGGLDNEERAVAEEALFRAGLHALRGHPRTRSVFETLPPHPSRTIRARSRNAALLVVADMQPTSMNRFLANLRRSAAHCPMRVVAASAHAGTAIDRVDGVPPRVAMSTRALPASSATRWPQRPSPRSSASPTRSGPSALPGHPNRHHDGPEAENDLTDLMRSSP